MKTKMVRIDKNGRMALPAKMRKQLNIVSGGNVTVEMKKDKIIISGPDTALEAARRLFNSNRKPDGSGVAKLLADRRKEFELEEEKCKKW
ncbi:AbrB/MazE/SpoVT family DNA-binding domain-containing protein [Candidatus Sneabacter namystus]|uniref:AbrB/MazE/SpoVT family DNA-binding domain-containing protein n=1 Tax=Candidatus Sneabacter namystus TaxID=2601646 RepID=A0A5C0UKC7_9RICK|nr:AbrB/MazE/SpoVT family DNA-binding domain-containing protein [Candidatus Sneabacter namystus]QEK39892.1 AbrB/MazE/SpoVT family DNA-binding domain-containing protein [Candidatus Sneabacter namystus]